LRVIQESESVILSGAPLLEIGDPRALEIVVDLLSADAVQVQEGTSVRIEGWGGAQLDGRVYRVEPYGFTKVSALGIEEQRVNVLIDFEGPPEAWQRLGHGYRVEVRIVIWSAEDVLRVPIAALFRDGDDWQTFVLSDGVAERRSIRLGHYNNLAAEVRDGLREGDQVVLHPSDRVSEGTRIVERGQEGY
jgi:HlyD family secretion protein